MKINTKLLAAPIFATLIAVVALAIMATNKSNEVGISKEVVRAGYETIPAVATITASYSKTVADSSTGLMIVGFLICSVGLYIVSGWAANTMTLNGLKGSLAMFFTAAIGITCVVIQPVTKHAQPEYETHLSIPDYETMKAAGTLDAIFPQYVEPQINP